MKNTTCCGSQVSPGRTVLFWTVSTRHRADLCRAGVGQSARGPREAAPAAWAAPPHPSLALISAQRGAHSSRAALVVTRHPPGHQTGPSSHLVQLWRGASGAAPPPPGRGPVPAWPEAAAVPRHAHLSLPAPRPFHWPSRYRTSPGWWGRGSPSLGQRAQALPSPGRQGRGSPSSGWGRPQALWPSWRPAVSLTVCCDARPTQREKADSVPHSGLTEPCLPTSSQSPEGSGRETDFKVQATSLSCSKKLLEAPARLQGEQTCAW